MSKDPAFLFYPNDWLGGTLGMTFEEKGAYLELLMLQFNRGHMAGHMIGQTVGQLWDKIQDKFIQDDKGLWFNERLEIEQEKRKAFTESRRNNIEGKNQYTNKNKKRGHMTSHMTGHMENENRNEDININNNEDTNPNVTIPISSNVAKIEKPTLHNSIVEIYYQWHEKQFGIEPQFDSSDGKAVKELIKYLQINIKNKDGGEAEILQAWSLIFEHYDKWDDFRKKLTRMRQIVPNISQIIIDIKKKTGTGKSVTDSILEEVRKHYEEEDKKKGVKK